MEVSYEVERLTVTVHLGRREGGVKTADLFVQGLTVYQTPDAGWLPGLEAAIETAIARAMRGLEESDGEL